MTYDNQNIFAKILRGEIPNKTVYEDDHVLAFHDIHPQKAVHVVIIPKGAYPNVGVFGETAGDAELAAMLRAVPKIAAQLGLTANGYRLITNCGPHGGQEVPHLHFHLLGGEPVGKMVAA